MKNHKSFSEFAILVRAMRDCQKEYFKTRDRDILIRSKGLESQVDTELSNMIDIYERR